MNFLKKISVVALTALLAAGFFVPVSTVHAVAPPCPPPSAGNHYVIFSANLDVRIGRDIQGEFCVEIPQGQEFATFGELVSAGVIPENSWRELEVTMEIQNCNDRSATAEGVSSWDRKDIRRLGSVDFALEPQPKVACVISGANDYAPERTEDRPLFVRYKTENQTVIGSIYPKGFPDVPNMVVSITPGNTFTVEWGQVSPDITIAVTEGPQFDLEITSPTKQSLPEVYAGLDIIPTDETGQSATIRWNTGLGNVPEGVHKILIQVNHGTTGAFKVVELTFTIRVDCAKLMTAIPEGCAAKPQECRNVCNDNNACIFLEGECKNKGTLGGADAIQADITARYSKPANYAGALPDCAFDGTCRDINDLLQVVVNYGNMIFGIAGTFAFIFFVYGGFMMITSFGNMERTKQGRSILVAAITGLIIVFVSYLAIQFILDVLQVGPEFRAIPRGPGAP